MNVVNARPTLAVAKKPCAILQPNRKSHLFLACEEANEDMCRSELATAVNVNVSVNVEFKVTLHEQVRYSGTLQY